MAGYVYVLRSAFNGRHTIGSTGNLEEKLTRYKSASRVGAPGGPWECVYVEVCDNLEQARGRERYLKSLDGIDEKISILYAARIKPNREGGASSYRRF